jgi:ketosteroid isomerase-like protein
LRYSRRSSGGTTISGDAERESRTGAAKAAEKVVRGMFAAWELGDFAAYLMLVHPDARLTSVQTGDRVLTREDLEASFESRRREDFFAVSLGHVRSLDEVAVLAYGSLRRKTERPRGHSLSQYVWLFTIVDQLVFRVRPFHTEDEARSEYKRHGISLGI